MLALGEHSLLTKMLVAPALVSIFVLAYLAFSYAVGQQNAERIAELKENRFSVLDLAAANVVLLDKITETLNAGASAAEEDMVNSTDGLARQLTENLDQIGRRNTGEKTSLEQLGKDFNAYFAIAKRISLTLASGRADLGKMQAEITAMRQHLDTVKRGLSAYHQATRASFIADLEATSESNKRAVLIGIAGGALAIGVALLLAYMISRAVKSAMDQVIDSLREIAQGDGDLRSRITLSSHDEIGELARWFNTFIEKLQGVIARLLADMTRLDTMSNAMSGVEHQTERLLQTERQQILNVVDQVRVIADQVQQVADSAASASRSAQEVQDHSGLGKEAINRTIDRIDSLARQIGSAVDATQRIDHDSQNISSMVLVIKDIADQTNLLALNAAIEAARAGETGRGFAVVADEVRKLAEKTKKATVEVSEIMETLLGNTRSIVEVVSESQEKANETVHNVRETGQILDAMLQQVNRMSEMNGQIAASTEQQRKATASAHDCAGELNRLSDLVASESSRAGEITREVAALATDLKRISNQFKV